MTSSFPIYIPLISFCCLIALVRTSRTILNIYGENGQPCLVPDFSGVAGGFSPFSLVLAVGLLYIAFIMFRYIPCIPSLSRLLSGREIIFCHKIIWHQMRWSCSFYYSICLYGGLWWQIIICWTIPVSLGWSPLFMVDDGSDVLLDSICQYFIEYFCTNVNEWNWSVILFLSNVFVWFGVSG